MMHLHSGEKNTGIKAGLFIVSRKVNVNGAGRNYGSLS
jgi:hypothetical protein